MIRRFQIPDGKHLTLPLSLYAAPGAKHHRMCDGDVVDLDFSKPNVQRHQRFIANRVKLGDLVELDASKPIPPKPAPAAAAPSSADAVQAKPFQVNPPTGGK